MVISSKLLATLSIIVSIFTVVASWDWPDTRWVAQFALDKFEDNIDDSHSCDQKFNVLDWNKQKVRYPNEIYYKFTMTVSKEEPNCIMTDEFEFPTSTCYFYVVVRKYEDEYIFRGYRCFNPANGFHIEDIYDHFDERIFDIPVQLPTGGRYGPAPSFGPSFPSVPRPPPPFNSYNGPTIGPAPGGSYL